MPPRLRADFTHGFRSQPQQWARKFAAGNVPEMSPYGMHRIGKHDIDLVTREQPRGIRRIVNGLGYRVDRLHWGNAADPATRSRVDVSIAWDERTGIPISLTRSRRGNVPLLSGCIWVTDQKQPRDYHVRALRRMDAVFVNSTAQVKPLRELGIREERIHCFPMGIAPEFFRPGDYTQRGCGVFSVGHDVHRDYPTLLQSVSEVRRRSGLSDVRLTLVAKDAVTVPQDLGVLIPYAPAWQLREHYRQAAVVAIATRPNVHVSGVTASLEAMACGRPVVATGNPGMEEYVTHGKTGLLVPPGDPVAMADAIECLLRDPARSQDMGEAARQSVVERFTTHQLSENVASLVRHVFEQVS